jgi:hypothetical protein
MNQKVVELLRNKIGTDILFFIKLKNGLIFTVKLIDLNVNDNKILVLDKYRKLSLFDINFIEQMTEQDVDESDSMKDMGMNYK